MPWRKRKYRRRRRRTTGASVRKRRRSASAKRRPRMRMRSRRTRSRALGPIPRSVPTFRSIERSGQLEKFVTIIDILADGGIALQPLKYGASAWRPMLLPYSDDQLPFSADGGHAYFGYQMHALPVAVLQYIFVGGGPTDTNPASRPYQQYFRRFDLCSVLGFTDHIHTLIEPHPGGSVVTTADPPATVTAQFPSTALKYGKILAAVFNDPTGVTAPYPLSGPFSFDETRRLGYVRPVTRRGLRCSRWSPNVYGFGGIAVRGSSGGGVQPFIGGDGRPVPGPYVMKMSGLTPAGTNAQYNTNLVLPGPTVVIRFPRHVSYDGTGRILYQPLRCTVRIRRTYYVWFGKRFPLFYPQSGDGAIVADYPRAGALGMSTAQDFAQVAGTELDPTVDGHVQTLLPSENTYPYTFPT